METTTVLIAITLGAVFAFSSWFFVSLWRRIDPQNERWQTTCTLMLVTLVSLVVVVLALAIACSPWLAMIGLLAYGAARHFFTRLATRHAKDCNLMPKNRASF